jgi:hypothetical protein
VHQGLPRLERNGLLVLTEECWTDVGIVGAVANFEKERISLLWPVN